MLYKCLKDYEDKFTAEKGHIYAMSKKSVKDLEINKLNKYFKRLSDDEEVAYISERSK
jgi:hypothetical protein